MAKKASMVKKKIELDRVSLSITGRAGLARDGSSFHWLVYHGFSSSGNSSQVGSSRQVGVLGVQYVSCLPL